MLKTSCLFPNVGAMAYSLLITCEHAGNIVPEKYKSLFKHAVDALDSHEGWDPGAWDIATYLGNYFNTEPIGCHTSRLLIEVNRSLSSPQLFSRYSTLLSDNEKQNLISEIYNTYRKSVGIKIEQLQKPVLHLSIHSFTPVYYGKERKVELGLLFDPDRELESSFCNAFKQTLKFILPDINVRLNEPYLGIDDGLTTHLRSIYSNTQYLGIEIEISQKFAPNTQKIERSLADGLKKALFP